MELPKTCRCLALALLLAAAPPLAAQDNQVDENVTWAYAQVLRASPVYRVVQVPTTEQRCDSAAPGAHCRSVPVVYKERRLVGYDVEYLYKGQTYMSRLAADPGARLRIRVSVMPDDPAVDHR